MNYIYSFLILKIAYIVDITYIVDFYKNFTEYGRNNPTQNGKIYMGRISDAHVIM